MKRKSVLAAGAMAAATAVTGTTALAAVLNPQLLGMASNINSTKPATETADQPVSQADSVSIIAAPAAFVESAPSAAPAVSHTPSASGHDIIQVLGESISAPESHGIRLAAAYVPIAPIPAAPVAATPLRVVNDARPAARLASNDVPIVFAATIPDPMNAPAEVPVVVVTPPAPKTEVKSVVDIKPDAEVDPAVDVKPEVKPIPAPTTTTKPVHQEKHHTTHTTQPTTDQEDD